MTDLQSQYAHGCTCTEGLDPGVGGVTWLNERSAAIRDKWRGILQSIVPSAIQPEGSVNWGTEE